MARAERSYNSPRHNADVRTPRIERIDRIDRNTNSASRRESTNKAQSPVVPTRTRILPRAFFSTTAVNPFDYTKIYNDITIMKRIRSLYCVVQSYNNTKLLNKQSIMNNVVQLLVLVVLLLASTTTNTTSFTTKSLELIRFMQKCEKNFFLLAVRTIDGEEIAWSWESQNSQFSLNMLEVY